jgi:hypothetical protein
MQINVPITITGRRIADLMVTAIEGGSGYWCKQIDLRAGIATAKPWYDDAQLYEGLFSIALVTDEGEEVRITNEGLEKAFQLMAEQFQTSHWSDFLEENEDADTADVFLQLWAFGEVVYG